ncbi:MAG: hypothetical protein K0S44_27 [Bacteroidetes bacterium]|jgi:hypothetical protein|nr:hypothetical protein [Bacteroidota bacterium]
MMGYIEKNYKKLVIITGCLFFSYFLFLSWIYYKERVLSFDPAFFAFQIIDTQNYSIALGRWGAIFSQILPLIALKSNCSMETFLRLFSIAPIINYIIVFLIIIALKNYRAAIALMLVLCLGFRHAFYYTTAELYFGLALSVLFWAIIAPEKEYDTAIKKWLALLFSIVLIYIMSYLHQLTVFAIVFILIWEFISGNKYKDVRLWMIFAAASIWFYIRIFVLTNTEYESEKIPSLSVFIEQLPFIRYSPSGMYFKHYAKYEIWPLFLVFFISWIYLFKMKKWLNVLFLPAFSIAFLVLILITYYKGESALMYENYYTVFGVFAGIAFMYVLYNNVSEKWRLLWIIPLLVISVHGIHNAHASFTKRVDYLDRLVSEGRKHEKKKFLVSSQNFPWQYGWVHWALPFETTLYSAIAGADSVVTCFVTPEIDKYDSLINKENVFLGPEWAVTWFESHHLKQNYFRFPSSGYAKLNTSQADSAFHESDFDKGNILIKPLQDTYYSDADSFIVAEIEITNLLYKTFASIPKGNNPVFLSYHIEQGGKTVVFDGKRTPLEADLKGKIIQSIMVTLPEKKGDYTVEVDLVTENKRWWEIRSKFKLIVR